MPRTRGARVRSVGRFTQTVWALPLPDPEEEVEGVGDGEAADDAEHNSLGGRLLIASTMALVLTMRTASEAHAFVPIAGCSDPGSPYDTKLQPDGAFGSSPTAWRTCSPWVGLCVALRDAHWSALYV